MYFYLSPTDFFALPYLYSSWSWDRSFSMVSTDWMTGVRSTAEAKGFFSSRFFAHSAYYSISIESPFAWLMRDADHSPPSSAVAKKE
jgi:hypothetical protein